MEMNSEDYKKKELGILQLTYAANNLTFTYRLDSLSYSLGRTCSQLSNYLKFGEPYARNTARMLRELADRIDVPAEINIAEIYKED